MTDHKPLIDLLAKLKKLNSFEIPSTESLKDIEALIVAASNSLVAISNAKPTSPYYITRPTLLLAKTSKSFSESTLNAIPKIPDAEESLLVSLSTLLTTVYKLLRRMGVNSAVYAGHGKLTATMESSTSLVDDKGPTQSAEQIKQTQKQDLEKISALFHRNSDKSIAQITLYMGLSKTDTEKKGSFNDMPQPDFNDMRKNFSDSTLEDRNEFSVLSAHITRLQRGRMTDQSVDPNTVGVNKLVHGVDLMNRHSLDLQRYEETPQHGFETFVGGILGRINTRKRFESQDYVTPTERRGNDMDRLLKSIDRLDVKNAAANEKQRFVIKPEKEKEMFLSSLTSRVAKISADMSNQRASFAFRQSRK